MPSARFDRGRRGTKVARAGVLAGGACLLSGCRLAGVMAPRGRDAATANALWWYMLALGGGIFLAWTAVFAVGLFRRQPADADAETEARTHRRFIVGGGLVLPAVALGSLFVSNLAALERLPRGSQVSSTPPATSTGGSSRTPTRGSRRPTSSTSPSVAMSACDCGRRT